jgi:hypothetical protein
MTDIVDALRVGNVSIAMPDGSIKLVNHVAADEIERLRDEMRSLWTDWNDPEVTMGDFYNRLRALGEGKE